MNASTSTSTTTTQYRVPTDDPDLLTRLTTQDIYVPLPPRPQHTPKRVYNDRSPIILPPLPPIQNPIAPKRSLRYLALANERRETEAADAKKLPGAGEDRAGVEPRDPLEGLSEPDPVEAINSLDYLSTLTAFERTELYRRTGRTRPYPSSSSTSPPHHTTSQDHEGWLSYLPDISTFFTSLKSRAAGVHNDLLSRAGVIQSDLLSACDVLAKLLAKERLENERLRKVCEGLKGQVRDVSARCCVLEGGGKGRGVKRRREEVHEEGSKLASSSQTLSSGKAKSKTPPTPKKKPIAPKGKKPLVEAPCAQIPIDALPEHARKFHPLYKASSSPASTFSSELTLSCASASASTSSSRTATPSFSSSSPRVHSQRSAPVPARAEEDAEEYTYDLPTPSYLPPFRSVPATPENKNTALDCCPPSPPKRVKSANGRIQTVKEGRVKRRRSLKHEAESGKSPKSTTGAVVTQTKAGEVVFEITPSPSPAELLAAAEVDGVDERERALLGLMYVNWGREVGCRACRIFTTYPHKHPKHLPLHLAKSFIPGTPDAELYHHATTSHPAEWDDLRGLREDEVALLKERLEAKDLLERERGFCSVPPPPALEEEKENTGTKTKARMERPRREWMTPSPPIVLPRTVPITMSIVKMRRGAGGVRQAGVVRSAV
ncbi:hypothetical protein BDQ17DRAFT_1365376 [Cyathus striatus]|nr:hypothetical protein BDQ17DRAFT_1365376 [Cyathus striatus]